MRAHYVKPNTEAIKHEYHVTWGVMHVISLSIKDSRIPHCAKHLFEPFFNRPVVIATRVERVWARAVGRVCGNKIE